MVDKPVLKVDFSELQARIKTQFRELNPRDPSSWPNFPRYGLYLGLVVFVIAGLWFTWLSTYSEELESERAKDTMLREDYKVKLTQAVNLDALKKQREQVQQYVIQLEKQLPSKAEMDALLSDINQAGLGRSLQFDLFRPGQIIVKDYYAELPITVRVTGKYHDIGAFASDIAHLSRIVTLNNLTILPAIAKDGTLVMDATAKTFRYLDSAEVTAQHKSAAPGTKK